MAPIALRRSFRFEDGPRDAEGIAVDVNDGRVFLAETLGQTPGSPDIGRRSSKTAPRSPEASRGICSASRGVPDIYRLTRA